MVTIFLKTTRNWKIKQCLLIVLKRFHMILMNKKQVLNHLLAVMDHKQVLILVNLIMNLQIRLEKQPKSFWKFTTRIKTESSIRKKSKLPSSDSSNRTPISSNMSHRMCSATTATTTAPSATTNSQTSALSTTSGKWRFSVSTERNITPKEANAEWTAVNSAPPSLMSSDTSALMPLLSSSANGSQWSTSKRKDGSAMKSILCSFAITSAAPQSQLKHKKLLQNHR